jgi:succinyl-CoA synthetase beta subunit
MVIQAQPTGNGIRTTVRELMHFGLWGKYCKVMHVENGYEDIDEEIYLPEEMMELLGI